MRHSVLAGLPALRREIESELVSDRHNLEKWTLVFSATLDGRSFPRLISAFRRARGPVLVVIEEQLASSSSTAEYTEATSTEVASSTSPAGSRTAVFGSFTTTPWDGVKAREMTAKSSAAAKARAERTGTAAAASAVSVKPPDQAPQFFGSSDCFIFRVENDESNNSVSIFKPRPSTSTSSLKNSNFQYFFDVHATSNLVGFGIGGTGAKSVVGNEAGMAYFVDKTLCRGEHCVGGCTTFANALPLSRSGSAALKIKNLEIWAIRDVVRDDDTEPSSSSFVDSSTQQQEQKDGTLLAPSQSPVFTSPALKSPQHATAKRMLELAGVTMHSENNDRCDM